MGYQILSAVSSVWLERLLHTQQVGGSNPSRHTKFVMEKLLRKIGEWLKEWECKHPSLVWSRLIKVGKRMGRMCPDCEMFIEDLGV